MERCLRGEPGRDGGVAGAEEDLLAFYSLPTEH
jgi:hypothetical protein